ncbi:MAG: helix-turn-helix domain-containing protein [Candidatus Bathyarchaeota archaeon]|nr:helix-turn-helix domain-containing protein [Candidatus Bathyarchaeota archaeon]
MTMAKLAYHPNAYLIETKNVKQGLTSRTRILSVLEKEKTTARTISEKSELGYSVVLHHLHLLEDERIVSTVRKGKPFIWVLTGLGQQSLTESSSS